MKEEQRERCDHLTNLTGVPRCEGEASPYLVEPPPWVPGGARVRRLCPRHAAGKGEAHGRTPRCACRVKPLDEDEATAMQVMTA